MKNVSGISYQRYVIENIIQPLGLNNTYLDTLPLQNSFSGYVPCNSLVNCALPDVSTLLDYSQANVGWGCGAADISSTSKDLIRFYYALQNGELLSRRWVDSMTGKPVDASNSFNDKLYGYGTMLFQEDGKTTAIGHTGTAASHANVLCQLKPSNIYIVFSFNIICANREAFRDELDNFINGGTKPEPPVANPDPDPTVTTSITIYPNPAKGFINIRITGADLDGDYQVQINNVSGQTKYQSGLTNALSTISTDHWASSIYFVKVVGNKSGAIIKKILVD